MADERLADKSEILARMAESYRAFRSSLDRAGAEVLVRPSTWGDRSLKDLIAHVVYWHTVAIDRLQKLAEGRTDEISVLENDAAVDEVNENVYRANRDQSLDDILDALGTTYIAFRTAAKSIPAAVYPLDQQPSSVRDWVVGNGSAHYDEHLVDIERAIQRE
jgi:hypothetical protein